MIRRERQEQADNFVNSRRALRPDEYLPVRPGIASQVEALSREWWRQAASNDAAIAANDERSDASPFEPELDSD
ncbi:MAG: hypothetical protein IOMNBAOH_00824 [Rhodocyclaceae bacterium]|nr:hypothetical protein [Rhodocyclaceae bacterium]